MRRDGSAHRLGDELGVAVGSGDQLESDHVVAGDRGVVARRYHEPTLDLASLDGVGEGLRRVERLGGDVVERVDLLDEGSSEGTAVTFDDHTDLRIEGPSEGDPDEEHDQQREDEHEEDVRLLAQEPLGVDDGDRKSLHSVTTFLSRSADYNPDGLLDGAHYITIAGHYAYILADAGLVILDLDDPLPAHRRRADRRRRVAGRAGGGGAVPLRLPHHGQRSGRGRRERAEKAQRVGGLAMEGARDLYVARTYAYVAAGPAGLAIVDVTAPKQPRLEMMYDADGALNDTQSVRIGSTSASTFAYIADGKNGLRVVQLISPGETPGAAGFSPVPTPRLIASYPTPGPAMTLSKGIDRDRAVDESGHQVSIFGRLGQRPFNRAEMETLFLKDGETYTVTNDPTAQPLGFTAPRARASEQRVAPTVRPRATPRPTAPEASPSTGDEVVPSPPAAPVQPRLLPGRT